MMKRLKPDAAIPAGEGIQTLRYMKMYEAIGWIGLIFFVTLFVGAWIGAQPRDRLPSFVTFGAMICLSGILIILRRRWRVEFDENGITYFPLLGTTFRTSWADIKSVDYSRMPQWWRLTTKRGQVIRVGLLMDDHRTFLNELRRLTPS